MFFRCSNVKRSSGFLTRINVVCRFLVEYLGGAIPVRTSSLWGGLSDVSNARRCLLNWAGLTTASFLLSLIQTAAASMRKNVNAPDGRSEKWNVRLPLPSSRDCCSRMVRRIIRIYARKEKNTFEFVSKSRKNTFEFVSKMKKNTFEFVPPKK